MKRILLIAAVLSTAQLVRAASIAWGIGSPAAFVTASPAGGTLTNYIAYLCVGDASAAQTTFETIRDGKEWSAPTIGQDNSIVSKNVLANGAISAQDPTILSLAFSANQSYNFYIVLIDASQGYVSVSSVLSGTTFDETGMVPATEVLWTVANSLGATSNGWQKIVPEPTALALLALGVAGVALRRRVA